MIRPMTIVDPDMALKDFVRVSINLFAPRSDENFDLQIADKIMQTTLSLYFKKDVTVVKDLM